MGIQNAEENTMIC